MNKLLILTEAGESIGYGHYMRCLALQKEAQNQSISTKMILHVKGNEKFDVNGKIYNWLDKSELNIKIDAEIKNQFDTILVDSYLADEEIYRFLKTKFKKVIVIDDYNRINYDADLIINPNVFFEQIDYSNQKAKCIGGKKFVLLHSIFTSLENKTQENDNTQNQNPQPVENILITLGGTDFRDLLPQLILICLNQNLKKIQVICPQDTQREELENKFLEKIKIKNLTILGKQSTQEMYNLYQKNDIIISACGQTLHELASQGKPTIGICLTIDQVPNQKYYLDKHFLLENINWNDKALEEKISSQLNTFQNSHLQKIIQNYAPSLVGLNGVKICMDSIFPNQLLTFRTAQLKDAQIYFEWANDELSREYAFNNEPIKWENHLVWFKNKINSNSLLFIFFLENSNDAIGQTRIEWDTQTINETEKTIGWLDNSVSKNHRGKKLATQMLIQIIQLLEKLPISITLKGIIKKENLASQKSLLGANFIHTETQTINNSDCVILQYETCPTK
ncbi:GNAT family N-acetyltransferase [Bernardetia sp. OM2101]|uniref:GNAT family N-acetyltransferase n=1 Tax=Bernardetia sp. OM2101 TaxID=3344876 RepID=UPI0035D05A14